METEIAELEKLRDTIYGWPELKGSCGNAYYNAINTFHLFVEFQVDRADFLPTLEKVKNLGIGYDVTDSWRWEGHTFYTTYEFWVGKHIFTDIDSINKHCTLPDFPYSISELAHRLTGITNYVGEEFGRYMTLGVYSPTKKACKSVEDCILPQLKALIPDNRISVKISKTDGMWNCEFNISPKL